MIGTILYLIFMYTFCCLVVAAIDTYSPVWKDNEVSDEYKTKEIWKKFFKYWGSVPRFIRETFKLIAGDK